MTDLKIEQRHAALALAAVKEAETAFGSEISTNFNGLAIIAKHFATFERDLLADMPTIWEDPAGKGYPCFERPMTPAECKAALDRDAATIIDLKAKLAQATAALEEVGNQFDAANVLLAEIFGKPSIMIETFAERARATLAEIKGGE